MAPGLCGRARWARLASVEFGMGFGRQGGGRG